MLTSLSERPLGDCEVNETRKAEPGGAKGGRAWKIASLADTSGNEECRGEKGMGLGDIWVGCGCREALS